MVGNRAAGVGASGTNVNKEHIQSKSHLKNGAFSCCGLFAAGGALRGGKERLFGEIGLPGLLDTIALPRFGFVYQFYSYPVPYEWLNEGTAPGADGEQARDGQSTSVYHYNQHDTIRIFESSALYRLLVSKSIWNVSKTDVWFKDSCWFSTHPSKQKSADKERASIPCNKSASGFDDPANTGVVKVDVLRKPTISGRFVSSILSSNANGKSKGDQNVGLMSRVDVPTSFDPKKRTEKKRKASAVDRLFRDMNARGSKNAVQLAWKSLGKFGAAKYTGPIDRNTPDVNTDYANTTPAGQADLSTLQQESIQRTIRTLATKSTNDQRERNAQFSSLQQKLKEVEQVNNQDMRRLQQSVQELVNMLSTRRQPVSFSSSRPPSLYGRLK